LFKSDDEFAHTIASDLLTSELFKLSEKNLDDRKLLIELMDQSEIKASTPEAANCYVYNYLHMTLDKQYQGKAVLEKRLACEINLKKNLENKLALAEKKIAELEEEKLNETLTTDASC
jgi:hypothetical protein